MTDEMVTTELQDVDAGLPEAEGPSLAEPPPDGPPAAPSAPEAGAVQAALASFRDDLLRALEEHRREDRFREEQVERLHRELQEHRSDLLAKVTRPLVLSLIRLHDDLGRCAEAWREKPPEELTPERWLDLLAGFQEDVEIELERFGIESYRHPDDRFDPQLQQALKTEDAPSPELAGRLVERLRPGYTHGSEVVRKEKVVVYRSAAPSQPAAGDDRPETTPDPEETT